jgi:hypothetical protein
MMISNTNANQKKVVQLEVALSELLAVALRRGFYGTAGVEVTVQDGTIQNIARRMERIEK